MSLSPTIFLLGATGYLGSQFLIYLARDLPRLPVTALVRSLTAERARQLNAVHGNLTLVEGTLDDDALIQEQAAKADVTINCASSDHTGAVDCKLKQKKRTC